MYQREPLSRPAPCRRRRCRNSRALRSPGDHSALNWLVVDGAILKTVLALAFSLLLVSCTEEPDWPERRETEDPPQRTAPEGFRPEETVDSGYVEHTVGGMVIREEESVLRIEEAELQRGVGADQIVVRAYGRGPADYRDCFLMEEQTWLAVERLIEGRDGSQAPPRLQSNWADETATEEFSDGDTFVRVFREDPEPDGHAADPREIPFFALCYSGYDPSVDGSPPMRYDVAHVEETPEP